MGLRRVTGPALLVVAVVCGGCASSLSGDVYSRDEARKLQTFHEGEVVMVREVQVEGTRSGLGVIAGGILGAALGSTIGGGSGQTVATAVGAVAGGAAGGVAEEAATRQAGLEITVKLDNGDVVSIVQGADRQYEEGDRVNVLIRKDGSARVMQ
jgi:outer membrane lipoprotein SlyB